MIAAGCEASFEVLYRRYAAICLSLARRILIAPDLAEDAVQVAFLSIWENADRFRPELGSARGWLVSIAHHKAVDLVRSSERHRTRQFPDEWLSNAIASGVMPHDQAETNDEASRAMAAIAQLTRPQREALMLCYYGGLTQREVAERLDIPLGTVKTRCRTALGRLRDALAPDPIEAVDARANSGGALRVGRA